MAYADGNIVIGTSVDVGGMNTGLYKIQKAMKRWTRIVGVGLTAGLYKVGKASVEAASDLQEIQNVVDVAFKDMSYKIEDFSKICIEHFGMAQLSAKQTAGSFMAMGASIGLTQEVASDMAVELTGLTGDFASFYNISQQYAKVALSAVYTGETETLKRYGIILTEANLQEYALTQGITKKVKAMNAEEKTLLRYNYIMQATMNMHGDFERTQESWANTLRVLKERWTQLLSVVGAGTIQVIQPFIRLISEATAKLIGLFQHINDLLGIEASLDTAEVSEEMEDLADSVEDAGETIKHQLGSFDKLNNIITTSNKETDKMSDLDNLYEKFKLSGYVIDAMKNWEVASSQFSSTIRRNIDEAIEYLLGKKEELEAIFSDIKAGDWFEVGFDFGTFTSNIEYDISSALNSVDWEGFGAKIGGFFKGLNWSNAFDGWSEIIATSFDAVISTAAGMVNSISLEDMIRLAQNVSGVVTKITKRLRKAISKVKWHELGEKIGTFFANLKWGEILSEAAKALWEGFKSALLLVSGVFEAAPVAAACISGIVAAIQVAKWVGLDTALKKSVRKAFTEWQKKQAVASAGKTWGTTLGLAKVVSKAIGVISIAASVAIAIADIHNVSEGDYGWKSTTSLFNSLAEAVCAGLGIGLLTANPVAGLIAAAATLGLTLGIKYALEPTDEEQLKKTQEELRERLKEVTIIDEADRVIQATLNLRLEAEARISDVDLSIASYEELAQKWFEMSQNEAELTDKEQILLKLYSDELIQVFPDLADKIDEVSGAYKGTWEELDHLITKTKEYMLLQAYEQNRADAYAQLAEIDAQKHKSETELRRLQNLGRGLDSYLENMIKMNVASQDSSWLRSAFGKTGLDVYKEMISKYGNMNNLVKEMQKALSAGYTNFGKYANESSWEKYTDFSSWSFVWSDSEANNNLVSYYAGLKRITEQIGELDNSMNPILQDISNWDDMIDDMSIKLENSKIVPNLTAIKEAADKVFADTNTMWTQDLQASFSSIEQKISENEPILDGDLNQLFSTVSTAFMGLDYATPFVNEFAEIRNEIISGQISIPEGLTKLAELMNKAFAEQFGDDSETPSMDTVVDTKLNTVLKKVIERNPDFYAAGKKAFESYIDGFNKTKNADTTTVKPKDLLGDIEQAMMDKQLFGEPTQKTVDNMVEGIDQAVIKNTKELNDTGATMYEFIDEGTRRSAGIKSPSKAMETIGDYLIDGLVIGIENGLNKLVSAASDAVTAIVDTFSSANIPTIKLTPAIDTSSLTIPDIARGVVVPSGVVRTSSVPSVSGMSKNELSGIIGNAVAQAMSNIVLKSEFNVNGDPKHIFDIVQTEARVYNKRTGSPAFAGGRK